MELTTLLHLFLTASFSSYYVYAFRFAPLASSPIYRPIRRGVHSAKLLDVLNHKKSSRSPQRYGHQLLEQRVPSCRRCRSVSVMMEDMDDIKCDVVIVGGGPAGCTCALYTSRANHKTVILDKSPAIGALARTELIANYPGSESVEISGTALLDQMREQAMHYGTIYKKAQVYMVEVDEETQEKIVHTPEVTVRARTLVLATGAMGRDPYFKGEDEFLGKGVSYCATCDAPFYDGSEVAVVGSNPEAVEEAEHLVTFAKNVHWITQKQIPENDDVKHLLSHSNVKHWTHTTMKSIDGDESGVTGVTLVTRDDDKVQTLPVEGVFIYIAGVKPITDFLDDSEVTLTEDGGVGTDGNMMTNVNGVFAIGDIRNTPFKQAVVAASDGCIAAMAIDRYLKGRKKIKVDWKHE